MSIQQPLADRIRPSSLDELIGQSHLRDRMVTLLTIVRLPSLLFFGPPGCGKSTLAILLAQSRGASYMRISAPEVSLTQLRKILTGKRILVLDELHRLSKTQQDFFLPLLETGGITLLATTTENPSFSVTRQLLSRLHVLRLNSLSHDELMDLATRGLRTLNISLKPKIIEFLVTIVNGDGRVLLNLLEYTAELPLEKHTLEELRVALPEVVIRHDRTGNSHYELASALIKSIRGSDPDAAIYYLACLLEGGENPRFICRRLIISASEDVGLADPMALPLAVSCQHAVELVGMPEGFIPLAETVTYLALAHKSNTSYNAYLAAQKEIRRAGIKPTPLHLRNPSTSLHQEWSFGKGYKYPHNYPEAWVEQDYLPQELKSHQFYHPKDCGLESRLTARWRTLLRRNVRRE